MATKFVVQDSYEKVNLSGTYSYELYKEEGGDRWKVMCWELVPEEEKVTGEETAREEFERWRK